MKVKNITLDELKNVLPQDKIEYIERLDEKQQKTYLDLYRAYSKMLYQYLIKNYKIDEYDKILQNSPYRFYELEPLYMDVYQYLAPAQLKYIYIRNPLYIERLDNEEKKQLISLARNQDWKYDDVTESFLQQTFRKVLLKNPNEIETSTVFYGPENSKYMVPDNKIVFGIRYDEYKKAENETDEEWENMQYLRMKDIETILMLIKLKFSKEIGIESHLIQYDEYSVNVRNNENERKVVYE